MAHCMPNSSIAAFIVSEITAFIRTNGQTDMARSNLLVIVIKNIYVYFIGSKTLSFTCYILSDESIIPFYSTSNKYKNKSMASTITRY